MTNVCRITGFICLFHILFLFGHIHGQVSYEAHYNRLSPTIPMCYRNTSLFNLMTRQPLSMENLINLIRKVENTTTARSWSAITMATNIVYKFRLDGVTYNPKAGDGAAQFRIFGRDANKLRVQLELFQDYSSSATFPEDDLTQPEKCALHWMLSHGINITQTRFDESCTAPDQTYGTYSGTRRRRSSPFYDTTNYKYTLNNADNVFSDCPVESGVVRHPSGSVAAGTMLLSLAVSTSSSVSITSSSSISLSIYPLYAASLAGDIAQYALGSYPERNPADIANEGWWNGTTMPRDWHLTTPRFSYMTAAEIRGGLDGMFLGANVNTWGLSSLKLSQVLEMYYSEVGMNRDSSYRACQRYSHTGDLDQTILRQQAYSFGVALKTLDTELPGELASLNNTISQTMTRLTSYVSSQSTNNCQYSDITSSTTPIISPSVDLYVVVDFTVADTMFINQQHFIAALAQGIDVSPYTSRMALYAGYNQTFIIGINDTSNGAEIAERAYDMVQNYASSSSMLDAMKDLYTYFNDVFDLRKNAGIQGTNTDVVLYISLGQSYDMSTRSSINSVMNNFRMNMPTVKFMFFTTSSYQNDFVNWVKDRSTDIITDGQFSSYDLAGWRVAAQLASVPKQLYYYQCNAKIKGYSVDESSKTYTQRLTPGTVALISYFPTNFYTVDSDKMTITFSVTNAGLRICTSRTSSVPYKDLSSNTCKSSSSSGQDVSFTYGAMCPSEDWTQCNPIYYSVQVNQTSGTGVTCQGTSTTGLATCRFPNQITFTVRHSNMQCNNAFIGVLHNSHLVIITTLLAVFGRYIIHF